MFNYRITKYNPKFRDEQGFYKKKEWTAISDIGRIYDGKPLTLETYFQIENAYAKAVTLFMDYLGLNHLYVHRLTKFSKRPPKEIRCSKSMFEIYKKISTGMKVSKIQTEDIARLTLRELLWCTLEEDQKMFVHFGYDYYMYIGSSEKPPKSIIDKIENMGLFVEEFESPYLPDSEEEINE